MGRSRTRPVRVDRVRTFAALKGLSDEGLLYLHEVFERKRQGAGPTWKELLVDLKARFNFEWNDSSLSRYFGYWKFGLREEHEILEVLRRVIRAIGTEVSNERGDCGAADRDPRSRTAPSRN